METLYVLELEDDKWYVGKSSDVARRFEQHKQGRGAAWTKEYKPIRIVETRPITSVHDETNATKDLMKKYGVDNVRGGAYAQVDLPEDVASVIRTEIRGNTDACYKCGLKGHFANRCPSANNTWMCEHCDEVFNTRAACERHERSCGGQLDYRTESPKTYGSCYRCGRKGHWAPDCYARSHVKGYDLD